MKKKSLDGFKLSDRLKYLRGKRDMTQAALSRAAGVSQSTIAQIESGAKDPSFSTITKLAEALDCHIAVLFAGDEVHVFDMKRLRKKYPDVAKLNETLYHSLGRVVDYARDIGFLK